MLQVYLRYRTIAEDPVALIKVYCYFCHVLFLTLFELRDLSW